LLKTAGQGKIRIVPARVIAIGPSQGFAWSATLDSGSRDGIKKDQTVINGDGLVGRVTSVGATTSTVLLAIDPNSSIGARAAKSSEVGIATGNGLSGLTFQLLNQSAPLREGDPLLTFGSRRDRPFIPGIPMGIITEVKGSAGSLSRTAVVKTYVNFSALDVVGVVVAVPARDPRDSLIPRSPTPAPTVTITLTPSSTAKPTPTPSVTRARTPRPTPTGT
jgi:rod shape-determining protein MreC